MDILNNKKLFVFSLAVCLLASARLAHADTTEVCSDDGNNGDCGAGGVMADASSLYVVDANGNATPAPEGTNENATGEGVSASVTAGVNEGLSYTSQPTFSQQFFGQGTTLFNGSVYPLRLGIAPAPVRVPTQISTYILTRGAQIAGSMGAAGSSYQGVRQAAVEFGHYIQNWWVISGAIHYWPR